MLHGMASPAGLTGHKGGDHVMIEIFGISLPAQHPTQL